MLKTLLVYGEPKRLGGVVNFMESLKQNLSDDIEVQHFIMGQRVSKTGRFFRILMPFIDSVRLIYTLISKKFDIVHLNPSLNTRSLLRDGLFLIILRLVGRQQIIVFFHGWQTELESKISHNIISRYLFFRVYGKDIDVFVLASRFKKSLISMGFSTHRVHLFSTMFDSKQVPTTKRKTDPCIKLLFMSRFERAKGIYELLTAFQRFSRDFPMATLELAGDGPEMQAMKNWVNKNELSNSIHFLGYLRGSKKVQAYKDATLFVFPTYYGEGCPVVLLEAMAAGLPIITGSTGGIPDIVKDGVHGKLLAEITPETIECALKSLISKPDRMIYIGESNYLEAWKKFEARTVTRKIETKYVEFLARG